MKNKSLLMFLILFFSTFIFFLTNCGGQISAQQSNDRLKSNNTQGANTFNQDVKTKEIPDEWKDIDFKNFKYSFGKLTDGKLDKRNIKFLGGTSYSINEFYYYDLTEDSKKEAIVSVWEVNCGGSCDGGSIIFYFYQIQKDKTNLIGSIETGSRSGGCFPKSFRIENKKIYLEQFGKCKKDSTFYEDKESICKFCVKDLSKSIYSIKNGKLHKENVIEIDTDYSNILNYQPEIFINQ